MSERRTRDQIYWEILVFCKLPALYGYHQPLRSQFEDRAGDLEFLCRKGYLSLMKDHEKTSDIATERAAEYIALFGHLYQTLFDEIPGFKL